MKPHSRGHAHTKAHLKALKAFARKLRTKPKRTRRSPVRDVRKPTKRDLKPAPVVQRMMTPSERQAYLRRLEWAALGGSPETRDQVNAVR